MKQLKLFALMLLAGAVFFTNCGKDEMDPPSVTVTPSTTDAWQGDTVTLTISMSGNQKFAELTITPDQDANQQTETVTTFSGDYSASYEYSYVVPGTVTEGMYITVSIKLVDEEDLEGTTSARINITEPAPNCNAITAYPEFTLGSYNNAAGSFFASVDGTVYTVSGAASSQSTVDFAYGYGATNHAVIFAPDDDISGMAAISTYGISSWTTKNGTRFKKVTTAYTWASITEDCDIVTECASGVTNKYIKDLANGDVVAFITAAGKKGFIKVNLITGTDSSGSIDLEVKVQQ